MDNILSNYISDSNFFGMLCYEPWKLSENIDHIIKDLIRKLSENEYKISDNIAIHKDAIIEPNVVIKPPCIISNNCFIGSFSYLRGGVFLGENVIIGPSVEIKSSFIAKPL